MCVFFQYNHISRTTQYYATKFCADVGEVMIVTQEFCQIFGA